LTKLTNKLRRTARCLWACLLSWSGTLWWIKRQLRRQGATVVLMLHRVLDDSGYRRTHSLPGILLRESTFRAFAAYIARYCSPKHLSEAEPGRCAKKLSVVVTFDDGWKDNYTVALPIAFAYHVPFTVFVCPGATDRTYPFWPERAVALLREAWPGAENAEIERKVESLKGLEEKAREEYLARLAEHGSAHPEKVSTIDKTLSWPEMTHMKRTGVRFGSHTQTHQILTTVSEARAVLEVADSKREIEDRLGTSCDTFAYPNGNWSPRIRQALEDAGFRLAVTTECGAWTTSCDRLAIPRASIYEDNVVGLTGRFSPAMFEYTAIWKAWRAKKVKSRPDAHAQRQPATATL